LRYASLYLTHKIKKLHHISSIYVRVNVILCREVAGIAANVDAVLRLIDANVVDCQMCGEQEMLKINFSEVWRYPKIGDDILFPNVSTTNMSQHKKYHGLLRYRSCRDLYSIICT
jgi:hypothetical protein